VFDETLRQNIATLAVLIGRAPAELTVKGGSLFRLGTPRVTPGLPSELLFQRLDIPTFAPRRRTLLRPKRAWRPRVPRFSPASA
jgi:hypothetical protein